MKRQAATYSAIILLFWSFLSAGSVFCAEVNSRLDPNKNADSGSTIDLPIVTITTNLGAITVELYTKAAPQTVANFLNYSNQHFYDGLIFHRVIDNFMIQTGGYRYDLTPKQATAPAVINESNNGLKNIKGSLAMARTADPNSARAQFFINLQDNSHLDAQQNRLGYTVFGAVTEGQATLDAIAQVPVQQVSRQLENLPKHPVQILSVEVKETK